MKLAARYPVFKLLPALLLAALLGAQVVQAGHVHADHLTAGDCLQCQFDTGQAVLPATQHTPVATSATDSNRLAIALAPVATHYRLAARGPPTLSR